MPSRAHRLMRIYQLRYFARGWAAPVTLTTALAAAGYILCQETPN